MRLDWRGNRQQRLLIQIAALAVLALIAWALMGQSSHRGKPQARPPPGSPVVVTRAQQREVPIILRGLGQVQAYNTQQVKSRIDGNIVSIAFTEGQQVHTGDLLIQIDPRPFEISVAQAQAAQQRDRAQLANARRDYTRDTTLVKSGLVTQQSYDAQKTVVQQLQATLQLDESQARQARLNLDYAAIKAPFEGRTGVRLVDLGNLVRATDQNALLVLTQTQPIFVTFTVPERDLEGVRSAMRKHPVDVRAFDADDQRLVASGHLAVIDNTVDPSTGTVRMKAEFANGDEALWPGEFVNAHVIVDVWDKGVTVPAQALQQGPDGQYVFRVTPQRTAVMTPVEVAQVEASEALVSKGLKAGDEIVVDGAYGLINGARVVIKPPAQVPSQAKAQGPSQANTPGTPALQVGSAR
ncbi:MAG: efflux transporter, family, subunit [Gammaproteobacteria bacterium]|nr:efflux transporter, family, subunit [Gammaproteobacteria bacterium]